MTLRVRTAVIGLAVVVLLAGCRASASAPLRDYLLESEVIATDVIEAATAVGPVRTGVDLRVQGRGGKPPLIDRDETSVVLFMRIVPTSTDNGESTVMADAIVKMLLEEGWESNPSLNQTAQETGEGLERWFLREDPGDSVNWDGDRPGHWEIEVSDRLDYVQIWRYAPFVHEDLDAYELTREIVERHPEWERPDDVLKPVPTQAP